MGFMANSLNRDLTNCEVVLKREFNPEGNISGDIEIVRPWEVEPLLQQLDIQKKVLEQAERSE